MASPAGVGGASRPPAAAPRRRLTPRRRAQLKRQLAYAIGVVVLVAIVFSVDFGKIQENFLDGKIFKEQFRGVITIAAKNTIVYTLLSFLFGLPVALGVALLRLSSIRPYRWLGTAYVELFRGLPALLTLILVGYALPIGFGIRFPTVLGVPTAGIFGLGIVAAAYMAETIRAGIEAVPKGQMEAARSLGMGHGRAMLSIVIPQAFRVIVPPLTNEFVALIKDTSLVAVLGTTPATKELTKFGRDVSGDTFNSTPLLVVGLAYLVITIPLTRLVAQLEKRNQRSR